MTDDRRDAIRSAVEQLNAGDVDSYLSSFTPECLHWLPGLPDPVNLTELRDTLTTIHAGFDELTLHEIVMLRDGDWVSAHWRMTGTHSNDFLGIAPTQRDISVDTAEIYEFDSASGLVRASWTFGDPLTLINQIS